MGRPKKPERPLDAGPETVLEFATKIEVLQTEVKTPQQMMQELRNNATDQGVDMEALELVLKTKRKKPPERLTIFWANVFLYGRLLNVDAQSAFDFGTSQQDIDAIWNAAHKQSQPAEPLVVSIA